MSAYQLALYLSKTDAARDKTVFENILAESIEKTQSQNNQEIEETLLNLIFNKHSQPHLRIHALRSVSTQGLVDRILSAQMLLYEEKLLDELEIITSIQESNQQSDIPILVNANDHDLTDESVQSILSDFAPTIVDQIQKIISGEHKAALPCD